MQNIKQRYDHASWTILASIIITVLVLLSQLSHQSILNDFSKRLDQLLYDLRFNISLREKAVSSQFHKIFIVDIDEKSLKTVGRWPWSRKTLAVMTQNLLDAGAAVITFDIVLSEPETNVISEIQENLSGTNQQKILKIMPELEALKNNFNYDQILAQTFRQHDIVLGFILHNEDFSSPNKPLANVFLPEAVPAKKVLVPELQGLTANLPLFQKTILSEGFISSLPDSDGVVRRAPLTLRHGDKFYGSLALQTALAYSLIDSAHVQAEAVNLDEYWAVTGVSIGPKKINTDKYGQMLIPYRGKRGTFPYLSAGDVLQNNFDSAEVSGAILLVGTSAIGLADLRATPVGIQYPGVESQATLIDGILAGDIPYRPDWAQGANVLAIILIFLMLNGVFPLCGPTAALLFGLFVGAAVIGGNFLLWHFQGIDLPLAGQLVVAALIFFVYQTYGFFTSAQQKNRIRDMFGQYVAPAHIEKMISQPENFNFDGTTKEMTVMFCDIRSFTSISEKLTANQLKEFLNTYFTPMTEIIFSQKGTIDKYVGDMIMAFWGAPLDDYDQQTNSVSAALKMIQKTNALKPLLQELGYPEVKVGIGLNTGLMNVGDMGSIYRRAYTVLGDAVNLGSRLESITKFYGVDILISESTLRGIEHKFLYRDVDHIQVKGKSEAIRVYEPLVPIAEASPEQIEYVKRFHEARKDFLNRQWKKSKKGFERLIIDNLKSRVLYSIYIKRCEFYEASPPDEKWRGVWKHESK